MLRAHDRILGEQNSITPSSLIIEIHFLQTHQSVFPIHTGLGFGFLLLLHVVLVLLPVDKSVGIDMVRCQTLHCSLRVTLFPVWYVIISKISTDTHNKFCAAVLGPTFADKIYIFYFYHKAQHAINTFENLFSIPLRFI